MRISIVRGDPGYDPTHQRRVERVTVDGLPVLAATADEEQGFVDEVCLEPGTNRIAVDPVSGHPLTRRVEGRVHIVLRPKADRDWDRSRRGEAKVQVGRDANGDVLVQVYSHARPGAIKQGRMARAELPSTRMALVQKVGLTAGALAEMLCEQFGDRLDPSECARVGLEQACRMLEAEARG